MPEGVARAQRWPHGALRAGRAAAFLTLAAGVNGTVAAYAPSWDPRWLYVAVVGLIAAIDGWIGGLLSAIGVVVCYELMSFGAFRFVADRDSFLLAAAIIAVVTARAMRVAISRSTPAAQKTTPLLTGFTLSPASPGETDASMEEGLASLRRSLEEERHRTESERTLRIDQENRARNLVEDLAEELRSSKQALEELTRERSEFQSAIAAAQSAARAAAERVADSERAGEQLRSALADAEQLRAGSENRVMELEAEFQAAREERARDEATRAELRNHAHDLEGANDRLRAELADANAGRDAAAQRAGNAEREREQLALKGASLEATREETNALNVDLQWSLAQFNQRLADAEAARAAAQERASELERLAEELGAALAGSEATREEVSRANTAAEEANARQRAEFDQQRYRLESEWNEKLARNAVDITDRFNVALMEADARTQAAKREAAGLQQRVAELERENADFRTQLDLRSDTAVDFTRRLQQLEAENAQIRVSSAELRASLEAQWRDKVEERDTAIERMQVSLSVAEQRARNASEEAAQLRKRAEELERAKAESSTQTASAAQAEIETLRGHLAGLESELAQTRDSRNDDLLRVESEWSEKFAHSAMEITQQFQSELKALNDQTAQHRAESERLALRLADLERENTEIRENAAAERKKVDADWNEKISTLAEHLASDHEHDLGQATLEREEARAEARKLAKRLFQFESRARDVANAFEELQKRNEALRVELEEQKQRPDTGQNRDAEWNAKLAANALELTQRFNTEMAAADARLQESRRESQNLASRVQELEQILAALRVSDQERRAAIDAEWSEKLQTIVAHLATDHEADIGQAIVEREAARAESRMHNARAAAAEKKLDVLLAKFEEARTAWANEREQLLSSIDVLRRRFSLGTYSGATPLPPSAIQAERTNPSVLIVHHDPAVRTIAKHALDSSGYDVTTASDGLEAFRVALSQRPDVILAEATMPKMDGRELVQMLKSRPETADVKIILMADPHGGSGTYSTSDYRADDYLRDPANVEAMKSALANVLGTRT